MEEVQHHAETTRLLGAIERPVRLTPRDRLELGLLPPADGDNDDGKGVDRLHAAAIASLTLLADSHETISFGIRCLLALAELCRELECSERLGLIGGHQTVLRLMTERRVFSGDARRHEKEKHSNLPPEEEGALIKQPHNRNCGIGVTGTAAGIGITTTTTTSTATTTTTATTATGKVITAVSGLLAVDDGEEQEGEEDEVQSAAALVAAHVVSSGSSFPMRPSFPAGDGTSGMGRFPLRYDFVVAATSPPAVNCTYSTQCRGSANVAAGGQGVVLGLGEPNQGWLTTVDTTTSIPGHPGGERLGGESISILVRPVKERQHSQFDVGFVMWPAAVILSRLLCRHPELVRGRRVLEIGAGLGLAGLVAARIQQNLSRTPSFPPEELAMADQSAVGCGGRAAPAAAASVTLSDFNPLVLRALKANVALNAGSRACCAADDAGDDAGEDGESASGSRKQSEIYCEEEEGDGGTPTRGVSGDTAEQQTVYVRHLDWDKLKSVPDVDGCRSGSRRDGSDFAAQVPGPPSGGGASSDGESASGEWSGNGTDSALPSDSSASRQQGGGVKGIEHGERFDVIIASDHICQASDAEGTIRVLHAMLAGATPTPTLIGEGGGGGGGGAGQAHFVVAHPRTRWGVDALVPLLEQCAGLCFTCEEVSDPELVAGLEEASYLAWLHVHVWRRAPATAAAADGMGRPGFDRDGDGPGEVLEPAAEALLVAG